jgi:hypothetical protein
MVPMIETRLTRRLLSGLLVAGLTVGCDQPPAPETVAPPKPSAPASTDQRSVPLVTMGLAGKQRFEVYETAPGELLYAHSGPYGSAPIALPEPLLRDGDPVAIFNYLAPGATVPTELAAAAKRAHEHKRQAPEAFAGTGPATASFSPVAPDPASSLHENQALGMRDFTGNGRTGSSGCPWEFFSLAYYQGDKFCPPPSPNGDLYSWCMRSVNWGFTYHPRVYRAYAAVCTDVGVSVLKVHTVDTVHPIWSTWVDQGTWQYVFTNTFGYPVFKKFDLTDTGFGPAVAHFGGILELKFQ